MTICCFLCFKSTCAYKTATYVPLLNRLNKKYGHISKPKNKFAYTLVILHIINTFLDICRAYCVHRQWPLNVLHKAVPTSCLAQGHSQQFGVFCVPYTLWTLMCVQLPQETFRQQMRGRFPVICIQSASLISHRHAYICLTYGYTMCSLAS